MAKPGHRGGGGKSGVRGPTHWAPLGNCAQDSPCPLLSFQVTSASLEASTAVHPPAREPEPRPGAPAESTPRGPRTAQEPGPARCQQSGLDGAGADPAGAGRRGLFSVPGCRRGSCRPRQGGRLPTRSSGTDLRPAVSAWLRSPLSRVGIFSFTLLAWWFDQNPLLPDSLILDIHRRPLFVVFIIRDATVLTRSSLNDPNGAPAPTAHPPRHALRLDGPRPQGTTRVRVSNRTPVFAQTMMTVSWRFGPPLGRLPSPDSAGPSVWSPPCAAPASCARPRVRPLSASGAGTVSGLFRRGCAGARARHTSVSRVSLSWARGNQGAWLGEDAAHRSRRVHLAPTAPAAETPPARPSRPFP